MDDGPSLAAAVDDDSKGATVMNFTRCLLSLRRV
jgi:hypothetical protein